jgi:hypothetical protein
MFDIGKLRAHPSAEEKKTAQPSNILDPVLLMIHLPDRLSMPCFIDPATSQASSQAIGSSHVNAKKSHLWSNVGAISSNPQHQLKG